MSNQAVELILTKPMQLATPESSAREILQKISYLNTSCPWCSSKKLPDALSCPGNLASNYILVVRPLAINSEPNQLKISDILGMITLSDILIAIAKEKSGKNLAVVDVMKPDLLTIHQAEAEDIFSLAHLWLENNNYPLLLSSPSGFFLGALSPLEMVKQQKYVEIWLKLSSVKDILNPKLISGKLTDSLKDIAKVMVNNQVRYVLFFDHVNSPKEAIAQPDHLPKPLGMITDQDIVNYWAIDLDLSTIKAASVINLFLPDINPEMSLWSAQKLMEQWQTSALVVAGDLGEFMGVIEQASWLKTLAPAAMYQRIVNLQENLASKTEALEKMNIDLQAEILKRQNLESELETMQKNLDKYVAECTDELKVANEQLKQELLHQQEVEAALRKSEAQSREQARQLEIALEKLQKTQAKLIQMEKMSGLGQLVAGIAHEINNPINFIYGNITHANTYITDLLKLLNAYQKNYPNPNSEIEQIIEEIELDFLLADLPKILHSMQAGAERIRHIVQSLRNFSRLDEAAVKEVDLHEGLESTLMILQHRFKGKLGKPNIEIYKDYGNLPKVECYPSLLNQVFMNLLNNALDALENQEPPQLITIRTRAFTLNSSPSETPENSAEGTNAPNYVRISIIDNGHGMDENVQKRLFEPFFTTKPVGKGTGLGLSISYQIVVEKHYGRLDVISAPGKGTELIIEIPVKPTHHPEPPLFEAAEA